jgi:hypothetical protein
MQKVRVVTDAADTTAACASRNRRASTALSASREGLGESGSRCARGRRTTS